MNSLSAWISAFRLRTLPLALAGILMGSFLAWMKNPERFNTSVLILSLITAICLQILSNLANDYGDFKKGTDNDKRLGTPRAMQTGAISEKAMQLGIMLFIALSLAFGIALIFAAFSGEFAVIGLTFFLVGIGAITAAIKYTNGKRPYGYQGLGDLFVFIFFGLVAVIGTFYLHSHEFDLFIILPAISIGALSTAVLNVNNIRDMANDQASGKLTFAIQLGLDKARTYHNVLIGTAWVSLLLFQLFIFIHPLQLIVLLRLPFFIANAAEIRRTHPSTKYNQFLKQLSMKTLDLVVVFALANYAAVSFVVAP